MSELVSGDINSIADFLAHALELETESAERYHELADVMTVHNNPEVAALFAELAAESELHAAKVAGWATGYELPKIAPWLFKWSCPEGPESVALADTHYLMSRRQALELARDNETRARDFYRRVAEHSTKEEVRRLAGEMAAEEGEHLAILQAQLEQEAPGEQAQPEDLDPPNSPE